MQDERGTLVVPPAGEVAAVGVFLRSDEGGMSMSSLKLPLHPAIQRVDWQVSRVLHLVLVSAVLAMAGGVLGDSHSRGLTLRAMAVYGLVFFVLRVSGKRTLAEVNTFDFVLLLIISEGVQQSLIGTDMTLAGAAVVICTLVAVDLALSYAKSWWPMLDAVLEGEAVQLMDNGKPVAEAMSNERVGDEDLLEYARRSGLESLKDVKHAVLERGGSISIVPK
jgi:hypothetical protein